MMGRNGGKDRRYSNPSSSTTLRFSFYNFLSAGLECVSSNVHVQDRAGEHPSAVLGMRSLWWREIFFQPFFRFARKNMMISGQAPVRLLSFPLVTVTENILAPRFQIQGEGSAAAATTAPRLTTLCTSTMAAQFDMAAGPFNAKHRGLSGIIVCIVKQEGPKGLYSGLVAGLHRQMSFASIRIGLYDSVKTFYQKQIRREKDGASMPTRIMAGITTGAVAVSCAQPTDVVKVRMQAEGANPFAGKKRYSGALSAYRTIAVEEGVKGLWKGTGPNIARNSIVNATELVCYDMVKEEILRMNLMTDNLPCHFTSAFITGFVTTCVASPVDVVKTRFMNSRPGQYTGALDCAMKMFYEGGPLAFYKGFTPSFMRLGSWNILMFVFYEQLKRGFTHLSNQNRLREIKAPM